MTNVQIERLELKCSQLKCKSPGWVDGPTTVSTMLRCCFTDIHARDADRYADATVQVIQNFSKATSTATATNANAPAGLFIYLPWHNTHTPLEAPPEYFYPHYPDYNNFSTRMSYNAMARALDEGLGNVTDALQEEGLWNETLLVLSADNGGWMISGVSTVLAGLAVCICISVFCAFCALCAFVLLCIICTLAHLHLSIFL